MEQLISIIVSVMLVTMCISGILTIAVFWYLVLSRLFDGITGVIPTDKQVEDMTKWMIKVMQEMILMNTKTMNIMIN